MEKFSILLGIVLVISLIANFFFLNSIEYGLFVKNTGDNITGNYNITGLLITDEILITPQSTPPTSPTLGKIYVDSDSNEFCFYNGTSWSGLDGKRTCA